MTSLSINRRAGSHRAVLAICAVAQFMVVLDVSIVNVALPQMRHELGLTLTSQQWVVNAYTLTFAGFLMLGGRAADLFGPRRVFLAGLSLFTIASLLGGLAGSGDWLITARAVQGLGGAVLAPTSLSLLTSTFTDMAERRRAMGIWSATAASCAAAGVLAGGILTDLLGWQWVLFVNVPIGLVALVVARYVLPETPRNRGRFDLTGALTSTAGVVGLVYGFVHAAQSGWQSSETIGSFAIGLVLLAVFIVNEMRAESPITPLRLFADRNRSSSYVARLFLTAGMLGMFFFLTQFLHNVLGYSNLEVGLAFLPVTAAVFLMSQAAARWLIELVGGQRLMIIGLTLSTLGMLWLTQLSESTTYLSMLVPLVMFGTGNGLAFVPLTTASLNNVSPADAGAASGLVNVMQQVGGSVGLAVLVTVFGSASSGAARHPAAGETAAQLARHVYTVGADKAFWTATAFLAGALLLVIFAIRTPAPAPAPAAVAARGDQAESAESAASAESVEAAELADSLALSE
jgi:EmrB/QacA subfamily drug resistance transporter